jgi:F0F1-type ATP synthase membrane subunit c/vacuolar-type H+-ATPase subunit K
VILPIGGAEKRRLFNAMSRWALAGAGAACGAPGYGAAGPLGAALGLGMGLVASARYLVRNCFHRG